MGIFDFFKKKDKDIRVEKKAEPLNKAKTEETKVNTTANEIPQVVEVVSDDQGSHGDNFGGLLGFNYLNSDNGNQFINKMIALAFI